MAKIPLKGLDRQNIVIYWHIHHINESAQHKKWSMNNISVCRVFPYSFPEVAYIQSFHIPFQKCHIFPHCLPEPTAICFPPRNFSTLWRGFNPLMNGRFLHLGFKRTFGGFGGFGVEENDGFHDFQHVGINPRCGKPRNI